MCIGGGRKFCEVDSIGRERLGGLHACGVSAVWIFVGLLLLLCRYQSKLKPGGKSALRAETCNRLLQFPAAPARCSSVLPTGMYLAPRTRANIGNSWAESASITMM